MKDWPVHFEASIEDELSPDASFLIPFGGQDRRSQLLCCLASLMGQKDCTVEIIVIEQSTFSSGKHPLPKGIRHVIVKAEESTQFNKSWLFNVGARHARGKVLLLHDADMITPAGYAKSNIDLLDSGLDAVRPGRFIFYLNELDSRSIQEANGFSRKCTVQKILQNTPMPLVVSSKAYSAIGGHYEAFSGWGAEDLEFLQRLRTLTVSEGAFVPIIHLWHADAGGKRGDRNMTQFKIIQDLPPESRISKLKDLPWGGCVPLKDTI